MSKLFEKYIKAPALKVWGWITWFVCAVGQAFKLLFDMKLVCQDIKSLSNKQLLIMVVLCLMVSASNIYHRAFYGMDLVNLLSGITGLICVYLINMRKLSNYFWGFVQAFLYGAAAWHSHVYGDMQLNFFFYVPMQVLGIYLWSRQMNGDEVVVKNLNWYAKAIIAVACVAIALSYRTYLESCGDISPAIDSWTNVLSIVAMFLMLFGYWENWPLWIIVNGLSIIIWIKASQYDIGAVSVLLMWCAYFLNSIWGCFRWLSSFPKFRAGFNNCVIKVMDFGRKF